MLFLYSLIGILATACFSKLLYTAIQPGQIFGAWQIVLRNIDQKGYSIVKPLGYCHVCWCNMWALISWVVFFLLSPEPLGWLWIIHFLCYHSIAAIFSLFVLVKLFK